MQVDRRIYRSDAERRALDLLRGGRWVRLVAPQDEDDDYEVLSADTSDAVPPAGAAAETTPAPAPAEA